MPQDEVFRDPSLKQIDGWRVTFNGHVQSPVFNSPGAAQAMLNALKSGARKPEVETIYVKVGLWIKAETPQEAANIAKKRLQPTLNDWCCEDKTCIAPFPAGSLLYYTFFTNEDSVMNAVNDGGPNNPAQFSNDNG